MSRRVSLHDRDDADGITGTVAAAKTSTVVDTLIAPAGQTVDLINVDQLFAHPDNPRGEVGDVDELAASIKTNGLLEPLIVCHAEAWQAVDDRLPYLTMIDYVIIAGHRRKTAAVQAGLRDVPCIVRDDLVGADAEVAMLVENLQREDLTPLQEARGFQRLEQQGKSQREIARLTGKQQPHVSKRLALLKLPAELLPEIGTDKLPIADAVEIAKVADDPVVVKAIMARPKWQSITQAADQAAKEQAKKTALEDRKKQLRASGITNLVKYPAGGLFRHSTPVALRFLEEDGVDISEHEHFACHAVAVGYSTYSDELRVEPVCTNVKSHPDSSAAKDTANRETAAAKRERDEARREKREKERHQILAGLADKPTADVDDVAQAMILDLLLEFFWRDAYDDFARLLGLTVGEKDGNELQTDEAVRNYAASSKTARHRVITLAALLQADDYQSSRTTLLQLLERHGYKLDADEKRQVKSVGDKPAPVEVPEPVVDADGFIACVECDHGQPAEACACTYCACNPANVDEPADAEAVPA